MNVLVLLPKYQCLLGPVTQANSKDIHVVFWFHLTDRSGETPMNKTLYNHTSTTLNPELSLFPSPALPPIKTQARRG